MAKDTQEGGISGQQYNEEQQQQQRTKTKTKIKTKTQNQTETQSGPQPEAQAQANVQTMRRTVAKKACLACRDKKIKCDGELLLSDDINDPIKKNYYKKCTNCKNAGIDCVFVPSKRGGRRKRRYSHQLKPDLSSQYYDEASSIVSASVVSNFDNIGTQSIHSNYHNNYINSSSYPDPQFSSGRNDLFLYQNQHHQKQQPPSLLQQQQPLWNSQYNMYVYPDMNAYQQQQQHHQQQQTQNQKQSLNQRPMLNPSSGINSILSQQNDATNANSNANLPTGYYPLPRTLPGSQNSNQNQSLPPLPYGSYMYQFPYPPVFYPPQQAMPHLSSMQMQMPMPMPMPMQPLPPLPPQQMNSINDNLIYGEVPPPRAQHHNSLVDKLNKPKFIDFEDETSRHYLKRNGSSTKNDSLSDQTNSNDLQQHHAKTDELKSPSDKSKSNPNYELKGMEESVSSVGNVYERNDDVGNRIGEGEEEDNNSKDSWSVSIAPSDSVTMIAEKRRRLENFSFESKFTPINESPLVKECEIQNRKQSISTSSNSTSNSNSNSNPNPSNTTSNTYTNNSISNKFKNFNEESTTDVSITERWINEQSNELKKSELKKKSMATTGQRQKHGPLHLDLKLPTFLNEELLQKLKLPDYQTLYKMVGIFYKYVHPNFLTLPNMSYFFDYIGISYDFLAILACMLKISIKYISNKEIANEQWLEECYWQDFYEETKPKISIRALVLCSLLQCSRGDDQSINICIESLNAFDMESLFSFKCLKRVELLKDSLNRSSLLEREMFIRLYWSVYRFSLYRRLSFGYPYEHDASEPKFKLLKNIEPPLPDSSFYAASETLVGLENMYKDCWISSINPTRPEGTEINDSTAVIVSSILLEEVMDSIANKTVLTYTLIRFCHRLKKVFEIHKTFEHLQPYQLKTHPDMDPHIVINASNFTSVCVNRMTCLFLGIDLAYDLLLYKPKSMGPVRTQLYPFNDSSPVEVNPQSLIKITKSIGSDEHRLLVWTWFFKSIDVSVDIISLLKLGEGVCAVTYLGKDPLGELFETVIGPCCSGQATVKDWCKFNTWTRDVSNIPVENQGWIPMPEILTSMIFQVWSFLSSLAVSLKAVRIVVVTVNNKEGDNKVDKKKKFEMNKVKKNVYDPTDAETVHSESKFEGKSTKDKHDIGGVYTEDQIIENENKRINILSRETGEVLVSGIEYLAAPNTFDCLISHGKIGVQSRGIIEKMKLIRKYLGIMGDYHGDCKLGVNYCDKVLDYVLKLLNEE